MLDVSVYEARISNIDNVVTSVLRRVEELREGELGASVNESGIQWAAALVQHLVRHLESVKRDGEDQCKALRELCIKHTAEHEKLILQQESCQEAIMEAEKSKADLEKERRGICQEQRNVFRSIISIDKTIGTKVATKVTDMLKLFRKLEMESQKSAEGDLAKALREQDILHTSFQKLGSIVDAKDDIIQSLRDKMDSETKELNAEKFQVKMERQRLAAMEKDLDVARTLAQGLQDNQAKQLSKFHEELFQAAAEHNKRLEKLRMHSTEQFDLMHDQMKEEVSQVRLQLTKVSEAEIVAAQQYVKELAMLTAKVDCLSSLRRSILAVFERKDARNEI